MRMLVCAAITAGLVSCALPASTTEHSGEAPLAWRLVNLPAPGGTALVLEAYDPTGDLKLVIRYSREWASVGDTVDVEVRLPEETGPHRLEFLPDRDGVEIVGPREFWTDGPRPVVARFTCRKPGRGGVTVRLKE